MKEKGIIITLSVVLGTTLMASLIALIIFISTTKTYQTQLENVYKKSLYELNSNLEDVEIDMSKLVAVNDKQTQREVLTNIYNNCQMANVNISNLPIQNNKIDKVNDFLNILGGYSYSLIEKVNHNTNFTDKDYSNIYTLHERSLNLLTEFNNYMNNMKFDYSIIKNVNFSNGDKSHFNGGLENININSSKVPSLIYDGPFSESVVNKEIKGLSNFEIDAQEAYEIVATELKFLDIKEIKYLNETDGKFVTYNFNVFTNKQKLYVQITKKGGQIVDINSFGNNSGNKQLSIRECEKIAENFATQLNYEDMNSVWHGVNGNIIYINLAPVKNAVIYYPDLVKVKVDMMSGNVVGLEGVNYCYNHINRKNPTYNISIESAQKKLSKALTVKEKNIALIPNKFVGETLTYEFVCEWKNYEYFIYIDVETGNEVNVLRVVKTIAGDLII